MGSSTGLHSGLRIYGLSQGVPGSVAHGGSKSPILSIKMLILSWMATGGSSTRLHSGLRIYGFSQGVPGFVQRGGSKT